MSILDLSGKRTEVSILIDLRLYKEPESSDILDLSEDQLDFIKLTYLPKYYKKSSTLLFYRFGTVRVHDDIVPNIAAIFSRGLVAQSSVIDREHLPLSYHTHNDSLEYYKHASPLFVITYLTKLYNTKAEHSFVISDHVNNKKYLRYTYVNNNSYYFLKRIQKLDTHDKNYIITNLTLREIFNQKRYTQ